MSSLQITREAAVATARSQGRSLEWSRVLPKLRGVVLLAGSVRPTPLRKACGRFFLELPVESRRSVMDLWHQQLTQTAVRFGLEKIAARVVVDRTSALPPRNVWNGRCDTRFEQDPSDFRGTGGLLRDIAEQYEDDEYLLVVNAAQILFEPLADLAEALAGLAADVGIACQRHGVPTGVMLVRCGSLRGIAPVGFVDLNEQALPNLAKTHEVRVLRGEGACGMPIRTLQDYVAALRHHHHRLHGISQPMHPFDEAWQERFAVVEPEADVHASALLHDAVVLDGARVAADAVVVRSLVCPGGVVGPGAVVVDRIVEAPAHSKEKEH